MSISEQNYNALSAVCRCYRNDVERLEKENEQLRKENEELKKFAECVAETVCCGLNDKTLPEEELFRQVYFDTDFNYEIFCRKLLKLGIIKLNQESQYIFKKKSRTKNNIEVGLAVEKLEEVRGYAFEHQHNPNYNYAEFECDITRLINELKGGAE